MQHTRRGLTYVTLIIVVLALPTAGALGWFYLTHDPNLRPLGVTREALRAYGEAGMGAEVVAYVDWVPTGNGADARRRLADALTTSFAAKGVDVRVVFREGRDETRITYEIGKSLLGPYPASRASEGVAAAVEAYRMY